MSTKRLEAHVRFVPGVAILDLRGEMNALGEEVLNAAYAEAEGQAPDAILLNFSQVPYINSTGLALIVGLLARAPGPSQPAGLRTQRPLSRDFRDYPPG